MECPSTSDFTRKSKRGNNELHPVAVETNVDYPLLRDMASVVRGAPWFGAFTFYFTKLHGTASMEIPDILFCF